MKILCVGHSIAHYRQRKMWEWIAEQGHQVNTVVLPNYHDEIYEHIKTGSFEQHLAPPYQSPIDNFWFFPSLHEFVAQLKPDILFAVQEPWQYATYHALKVAQMFRIPFGFFTWENILKAFPEPYRTMESTVIKEADLAVGGNRDAARILLQKGAGFVVQELQTGLDTNLFVPEPRLNLNQRAEPKHLLFVGRLVKAKGIEMLLKTFDRLDENYILRFVGGRGELEPLIKSHPEFGARITLDPWKDYSQLPRVFNWADVLILPSIDTPMWIEQCGYVIGESLLCHVPVIASASKSILELWKFPGVSFSPQNDVDSLYNIITSPSIYGEILEGRQIVMAKYSVEAVGQRYIEFLGDTI